MLRFFLLSALSLLPLARLSGQAPSPGRPYVFLMTPIDGGTGSRFATIEAGYVDRAFQPIGGDGAGQAVALGASLTRSVALVARAGTSIDSHTTRTSAEAEVLWTGHPLGGSRSYLTIGGGAVRSYDASNAVRLRFGVGHLAGQSRLDASVALERPLASSRDEIDLITTVGWMTPLTSRVRVGVEGVGQDLEGFWDSNEAEGGARLYVGPSLAVSIGGWQLGATAGPIIHATHSERTTDVERPLGADARGTGLGVRMAMSRAW